MSTPATPTSCDILVFGGTGDLALHKLLPALYRLHREDRLPADTRIFALARSALDNAAFLALAERNVRAVVARSEFAAEQWKGFAARLDYLAMDASQTADFGRLARHLKSSEGRVLVHYLATSPSLFAPIAQNLSIAGLAGPQARIVLEKPLGHSLDSARAINQSIGRVFDESRVFRIDHYLGKETVQNLMALRFANALFEPVWRAAHIDHVQISVNETLGVENRGGYYDHAGAMRDMVQNHLLQLLCLVAMEAPVRFDAEAVRNEKLKVLQALKPISGLDVQDKTVRGQYAAGRIGGQEVPAYYFEKNVDNDSDTETFVALQAEVENWRWAGVPFYLRTGKRMPQKLSQIVIHFKEPPHYIFAPEQRSLISNRLIIRLQPDEGISLQVMTKDQGLGKGMQLRTGPLQLSFSETYHAARIPDAYERLLLEVTQGNQYLFVRKDEVEFAWKWCDQLIAGWERLSEAPKPYPAGSWGPVASVALVARDGRSWYGDF